jgi:hypothetical protein
MENHKIHWIHLFQPTSLYFFVRKLNLWWIFNAVEKVSIKKSSEDPFETSIGSICNKILPNKKRKKRKKKKWIQSAGIWPEKDAGWRHRRTTAVCEPRNGTQRGCQPLETTPTAPQSPSEVFLVPPPPLRRKSMIRKIDARLQMHRFSHLCTADLQFSGKTTDEKWTQNWCE